MNRHWLTNDKKTTESATAERFVVRFAVMGGVSRAQGCGSTRANTRHSYEVPGVHNEVGRCVTRGSWMKNLPHRAETGEASPLIGYTGA